MTNRVHLHRKIRHIVSGTKLRPRLCVHRSLQNISCQLIDDEAGVTLVAADSRKMTGSRSEKAVAVSKELVARAKEKNISQAVFDRGGYRYHGAVKLVAETARQEGLQI